MFALGGGGTYVSCVRYWAAVDASLMKEMFSTFWFLNSFGGVTRENCSRVEWSKCQVSRVHWQPRWSVSQFGVLGALCLWTLLNSGWNEMKCYRRLHNIQCETNTPPPPNSLSAGLESFRGRCEMLSLKQLIWSNSSVWHRCWGLGIIGKSAQIHMWFRHGLYAKVCLCDMFFFHNIFIKKTTNHLSLYS